MGPRPPVEGPAAQRSTYLRLRYLLALYPPYIGAGVRPHYLAADLSCMDVKMVSRFWNRNYVGTHFGGSLYSMCDPHYMLLMMEQLGRGYLVWDKAASIEFKKPGKGTLWARFHLPPDEVERVRNLAETEKAVEPVYTAHVLDGQGDVVAEVEKRLWVRKKRPRNSRDRSSSGRSSSDRE